jgi:hypothetical protein
MRPWTVFSLLSFGCASAASEPKPQPSSTPENAPKLACARPGDCGAGNTCCTTPLWDGTYCAARCDLANNGQVCSSDADCPELGGTQSRCSPVSPIDAPGLPPALEVCQ